MFFVNAASFLAVIIVVATVSVPARVLALPREHVRSATRAGARFVRNSPALLAIMIRVAAFGFFASGVWALLPLLARHTLGLGSATAMPLPVVPEGTAGRMLVLVSYDIAPG